MDECSTTRPSRPAQGVCVDVNVKCDGLETMQRAAALAGAEMDSTTDTTMRIMTDHSHLAALTRCRGRQAGTNPPQSIHPVQVGGPCPNQIVGIKLGQTDNDTRRATRLWMRSREKLKLGN